MKNIIKNIFKKKEIINIIYVSLLIIIIIIFLFLINSWLNNDSKSKLQCPIFRVFDIDLDDPTWDYHLDNIQKAKGNHVLISPIQPIELYNNEWWSKYQPLSYIITDDMQTKLKTFCQKASQRNIKVIVDVVWNHTSITIYNEKTKYRYHEKNVAQSGVELPLNEITNVWFSDGLPDLNTELPEIKQEGRRAVEIMRKCGAKGFRMDASNYIDEEFFNYVYENSPSDELHIYEVWVENITPYDNWMLHRIQHDKCEVVFYDLSTYFYLENNISKLNNNKNKSKIFPFIPSEFSMNATINQDLILQYNKDSPLYLYMYFLLSLFIGNDKYFVYGIFSNEETESSILIEHLLFNWENYFNNVEKIRKMKEGLPKVLGTIELFKYDDNNNNEVPLIIGSIGKNYKMLLNLKNDFNLSTDSIPCKKLFEKTCNELNLVNLFTDKKLSKQKYTNDYIYCPQFSYSIIHNKTKQINKKINIIMFWYQGYNEMPNWGKQSVKIWSEFENVEILFFDRKSLNDILSHDELNVVLKIEEKIEKPWVYAAVCDYIRWVLLLKYNGGIYIDCDVYPSSTSIYLLNCVYEYNYLILGKEPSNFINNAIIVASPKSCNIIKTLLNFLVKNIYEKHIDIPIDNHNTHKYDTYDTYAYDSNKSPFFNWIIANTGPSFIKDFITNNFKDSNDILILDSIWLYSTYYITEKTIDKNCGNNIGLIQHCYAGNWLKKN